MAHVQTRTKNGTERFVARWLDGDGNERSRTRAGWGKKQALAYAFEQEAEAVRHTDLDARRQMTLSEWLDEWLDEHIAPRVVVGTLAPRTATGYLSVVETHIRPRLGHLPLQDLRATDVSKMMRAIVALPRKPATANGARRALSAALTDAGAADLVDRNAAKLARPIPVDAPVPSAFAPDEVDRIFDAAHHNRLGTAVVFSVLTDLRASELAGLDWDDIIWGDQDHAGAATFQVTRTTHRIPATAARVVPETGLVDSRPKNAASGKRTKMPALAAEVLRDQRRRQNLERIAATEWHHSGRIWTTTVGTRLDGDAIRAEHYAILEAAGVPRVTPDGRPRGLHELRRTWVERQRRAGIPPEDAAKAGRWASPATMTRHYSAVPDDRLAASRDAAQDGLSWG